MQVLLPESLDDALAMKAEHPDAVPMAGTTDLLVCWPEHPTQHDRLFLDLSGVDELRPAQWSDDAYTLGAMTTYWDVISDDRATVEFPMLREAAVQVGAVQIQTRGTWAGNIANGSPAADGVPVLMAYDAVVTLASANGRRDVPIDQFYHGYKELEMRSDELIESIAMPRRSYTFARFHKVGSRRAQAIAKVGVAVARSDAGWRVVASSVAPTVRRCRAVEALLEDGRSAVTRDDLDRALGEDVTPIDDLRSTAAYRMRVLGNVLAVSLDEAVR